MADFGVGNVNPSINPNQSAFRGGGGQKEPAAKGGNATDPADISSMTGAATVQQSNTSAPSLEIPGGTGGGNGGLGTPSPEGIKAIQAGLEGKGQKVDLMA